MDLELGGAGGTVGVQADPRFEALVFPGQLVADITVGVHPDTVVELSVGNLERMFLPVLIGQQFSPPDIDRDRFQVAEARHLSIRGNEPGIAPDVAVTGTLLDGADEPQPALALDVERNLFRRPLAGHRSGFERLDFRGGGVALGGRGFRRFSPSGEDRLGPRTGGRILGRRVVVEGKENQETENEDSRQEHVVTAACGVLHNRGGPGIGVVADSDYL